MILANGDTVHPVSVEKTLLAARGDGKKIILALDTVKSLADEEMKVVVDPAKGMTKITKLMDPAEATGEYIGVTLIEGDAAEELADALRTTFERDPSCTTRTATRSWSTAASGSTWRPSATSTGSRSTTTRTSPAGGRSHAGTDPAVPSPIVMDIRAGALDDLAGVLADQRISDSGRLAVAVSRGYGAQLRERLAPRCPPPPGSRSAAAPGRGGRPGRPDEVR
ncbi:protein of unknown function [Streptomyces murinus]